MLPLVSISNSISEIAFNSKSPRIDYNCDSFFRTKDLNIFGNPLLKE